MLRFKRDLTTEVVSLTDACARPCQESEAASIAIADSFTSSDSGTSGLLGVPCSTTLPSGSGTRWILEIPNSLARYASTTSSRRRASIRQHDKVVAAKEFHRPSTGQPGVFYSRIEYAWLACAWPVKLFRRHDLVVLAYARSPPRTCRAGVPRQGVWYFQDPPRATPGWECGGARHSEQTRRAAVGTREAVGYRNGCGLAFLARPCAGVRQTHYLCRQIALKPQHKLRTIMNQLNSKFYIQVLWGRPWECCVAFLTCALGSAHLHGRWLEKGTKVSTGYR